jgi:hypothetical protein
MMAQIQKSDPVPIDSEQLLELSGYNHRTMGVMLAVLQGCGHQEFVQSILDGFKAGPSKSTLFYYEQCKRALGID